MGSWGLGIFENDAASDFLYEVADKGLPLVRSTVVELKRTASGDYLERDDASAVLAIAVICLAKHGIMLEEARKTYQFDAALNACRGEVSIQTLRDVAWLVEQTLTKSELRDLWEEAGMFRKWYARVRRLGQQLWTIREQREGERKTQL